MRGLQPPGCPQKRKNDGRMLKFSFDNVYTFSDGKIESTHNEGIITKE